ncbi:ATP-binding protein [Alkalicoccus luteus]|uniref:ATP-binding protein n=1 Tax=Alkalicoccus luteus TaxID=1237094 RepID=UPI0040337E24
MKLVIFLVGLILFPVTAFSAPIEPGLDGERIIVHEQMEVFIDETGERNFDEIRDRPFESFTRNAPSFGYTTDVYWVRFQVDASAAEDEWFLKLLSPTMDHVTLYTELADGTVTSVETGDLVPYRERPRNNRNFVFPVDYAETEGLMTHYMRFETEGAMQFPLELNNQRVYSEQTQWDYLILGLLAGLAAVMALYNFFIYLSLRHPSYLFYVLFIIVNLFTFLSFTGLAYQFIWPEAVWFNNRAILFFMLLSNMMAIIFAVNFLELRKEVPRSLIYMYMAFSINLILLGVWAYSYPLALNLIVIASVATVLTVLTAALIRYRQGFGPSIYFLFAWQFFVIGVLISIFTDLGFVPYSFFTKYAWQIFTSVELVLFSFALANKITAIQKEKEEARQEALEALQRTDRLKNEFLQMTTHELRTPLNGMISIAESLREGIAGEQNEAAKKHLDVIIRSGSRLSYLIGDIVDVSRMENQDFDMRVEEVDLKPAVELACEMVKPLAAEKSLTIINEVGQLPNVAADEHRLQQILYNLLINAVNYTKEGTVRIRGSQSEETVTIYIRDTGIGISEEERRRLFEPFERGRDAEGYYREGMGIGLHLTKRLIELQGGRIEVESDPGKGSMFSFTLPAAKQAAGQFMPAADSIAELERNHAGAKRILAADDDHVNLQVIVNYLQLEGYDVTAAPDGLTVMEKLEKQSFDLVIMDVMMPGLSGFSVCKELRTRFSYTELPVLLLTAQNLIEDRLAAYRAGANDYLVKPIDRRELMIRVDTHLKLSGAVQELESRRQELENINLMLEGMVDERTAELGRKNAELEVKNDQLTHMEAARVEMLSNISHELGTPVTFLKNYIHTVREGFVDPSDENYLQIVDKKIQLLDRLIVDLFELVKLETGQMNMGIETVELTDWLNDVHQTFAMELSESDIHFPAITYDHIEKGQWYVSIDKGRMMQVFNNLIGNARKFTRNSIHISVETRQDTGYREFDGGAVIRITDNGRGMKKDQLEHIFKRFYKATGDRGKPSTGTGLGLAIAKEIIARHHGEIWVESEIGEGTTFSFCIPVLAAHARFEEEASSHGST